MRGGTFEIFVNLMKVLVTSDEKKDDEMVQEEEDKVVIEDYEGFASLVNGHGADGHTLAHWCAKRGMFCCVFFVSVLKSCFRVDLTFPIVLISWFISFDRR